MSKSKISTSIDRVSDQLQSIGQHLSRNGSAVKSLLIRLDRVANHLDSSKKKASLGAFESDLDNYGFKYSVSPSSGVQGTIYFISKSQMNPRKAVPLLQRIAKNHGANFDDPGKGSPYKLNIAH